jgi:hypothetical protein
VDSDRSFFHYGTPISTFNSSCSRCLEEGGSANQLDRNSAWHVWLCDPLERGKFRFAQLIFNQLFDAHDFQVTPASSAEVCSLRDCGATRGPLG